jgi:hypothetical protein
MDNLEVQTEDEIIFVNKLPKYFQCPICFEHLKEVCSTPCHHKFCKTCLLDSYSQKKKCPLCRNNLNINECHNDVWMSNQIDSLEVYCSKRIEGCEWKGSLSDLNVHKQKFCDYCPIQCINGCSEVIFRKDFQKHNQTCHNRLVECEYCHHQIRFSVNVFYCEFKIDLG